jgi:8-oxo-dGTP diphosphatase
MRLEPGQIGTLDGWEAGPVSQLWIAAAEPIPSEDEQRLLEAGSLPKSMQLAGYLGRISIRSCFYSFPMSGGSKKDPGPFQLTLAAEIKAPPVSPVPSTWTVKALAGCVVLDEEARVLLIHRHGSGEQWELPGGKVEEGESSKRAAQREVGEELGLTVHACRELGDTSFRQASQAWRYTWYLAEEFSGEARLREPERFDELRYFRINDLATMMDRVSPNVKQFVRTYFEGRLTLPCPAAPQSERVAVGCVQG